MGLITDNLPKLDQVPGGKNITNAVDYIANWARANSLWPLVYGTSCCAIEMMSTGSSKYDWSRFGWEVARATPRQADLIILAGTIVDKMADPLIRLYEQMPEPKYVIAMGACTISGGPFYYDNYSVIKGADRLIPVDVFIPGCPPRPEALLHGIMELQKVILKESIRKPKTKTINTKPFIDAHTAAKNEWEAEQKEKADDLKKAAEKYKEENPDYKAYKHARINKEKLESFDRKESKTIGLNQESIFNEVIEKFPSLTLYKKEETSKAIIQSYKADEIIEFVVKAEQYEALVNFLKNSPVLKMDFLIEITAVDWKDHFDLVVHLLSIEKGHKIFIRCPLNKNSENPEIQTLSHIYPTADWHEREVYDFFGIHFLGHKDLRRIFLKDDFKGYPLRKDFEDSRIVKRPY